MTEVGAPPPGAERVFGDRTALAAAYAELLATAGVERGLIGPRETARLWDRHLLNSAVLAEAVPEGSHVVDVGSGAGLPGIPLAIARPDLRVTLLEPLERRTVFLTEVCADLGLDTVSVVRGRAEDHAHEMADVVTSRAVAPLPRLLTWSLPLARVGGQVLALKGSRASEEVRAVPRAAWGRSGAAEPEVLEVGAGVVDPPTTLVRVVRLRAARVRLSGRSSA
ncbi:16S rRNA (guanine(527)-N(7))-methyltransferase RsmG [Nocardioides sp. CFH 31398]|uniref:16S rRNA (guanine(527)-N(7))-methyltransferase RsmG n=1 Tax=Nocardioides sp. CFH 31398 TaxID=2919579 RepID=UPI001F05F898|nr:16S rRNA (guanine(527)-N(7))-methyltransferase RsmG [Nocardioides sp. CFH 31398]MCH1865699.1 16S rRNA (guanine(527)-N(7))-methyltransferase RsmG [Nocardioides sp. CFH 31398]